MLQEQLIEEIKQIPSEKPAENYDLARYFRLGLAQEKTPVARNPRPIGLAKGRLQVPASFFEPLPAGMADTFEGR